MTEKSEQKKLLEKASAKNEQEIIEEIYLTSMRSQNWKNTKSSTILAISKALQKGKELGILTTAPQMPKSLAKGMRKKGEACEGCEHVILREDNTWCVSCTRQFNRGVDSGIYQEQERVSKLINDVRSPEVVIWAHKDRIKNQASKIAELQALNNQLTDGNREHNKRIAELEKENIDLKKQLSKMNSSLQIKLNKTRKLANRYNKALAFRKKDSVSLSYLRLEISKLANELEKEDMRNITVSYVQNLVKRLRGEK